MKSQILKILILGICTLPLVLCNDQAAGQTENMPMWQKICLVGGILLVIVTAFIYKNRNRQIWVRQLLRGYVSTGQSELTFVNIHHNSSGREAIEQAMQIDNEKSSPSEEDASYMEKDQQLSIDNEESDRKELGSVFTKKEGSKNKKSKTRKRLANTAKVMAEEESQSISPSQDL